MQNIINYKWYKERHENIEEEKERILLTAARLIKAEIKELSEHSKEFYQQEEGIASEGGKASKWLLKFLCFLVPVRQTCISFGQNIVYAARPMYAFPPLLFGLHMEPSSRHRFTLAFRTFIRLGILYLL